MSYVRLIRLPPHSETVGIARCWRKQLSSRGGGATNISRPLLHHRNGWTGAHAQSNGNDNKVLPMAIQGAHRRKFHPALGTATKVIATELTEEFSSSNTRISSSGVSYQASTLLGVTLALRTASTTTSSPTWGALESSLGVRGGGSWGHSSRPLQQSFRGFASAPPSQPEPKTDSQEYISRLKLLKGQKQGGLEGLLKPSDKEIEPVKDESAQRFKDLQEEYRLYEDARKNPRKASEQVEQSQMAISQKKAMAMVKRIPGMTWDATKAIVLFLWEVFKNPRVLQDKLAEARHHLIEFGRHYWLGTKLLWNDIKTARKILMRILKGYHMTRRERKQLLRTASDIFRMVPLAAFVLIPFMEFLLPVALRVFPNMLPSTFQDNLKEEEKLKKELQLRMAYAGFLQETVTAMAVKKKSRVEDGGESEATTTELTAFIEKAKMGEITNQDIPKFAKMFKDELTLDNISRSGLVNMCRYMGLPGFGTDNFMRFQLRSKLRAITQDDQRILWEGVASLTKQELQEACRERGMRATGLTKQGYIRQLSQWLDLSTKKSVPISLLIMSRTFTLTAPDPTRALAQSISAMDEDVVTEVMIEAASSEEQKTPEYRTRKLESLTRQNELIEEENKKREEAKQAQDAKKAEEVLKVKVEGTDAGNDPLSAAATAETKEDDAVNKIVEQAAREASARMAQGDSVLPDITMREGQKHFAATSEAGTKVNGAKVNLTKEPLVKEADIVAPAAGVEAGDRKVDPKQRTQELGALGQEAGAMPANSEQFEEAAENGGNKLTTAELDALESLASPSSVEKEKAQLAMMKAALQESLGQADEVEERIQDQGDTALADMDGMTTPAASLPTKDQTKAADEGQSVVQEQHASTEAHNTVPDTKDTKTKTNAPMDKIDSLEFTVTEGRPQSHSTTAESQDASEIEEDDLKDGEAHQPAVDKSVQRVQNKLASMLNRLELEIESVEKRIGDKMHMLDRDKDGMCSAEEIAHVVQHVLASSSTEEEAKAIAGSIDTDSDGQISVAELISWVKKHSEQDPEDVFNELYQRKDENASAALKKGSNKPPAE